MFECRSFVTNMVIIDETVLCRFGNSGVIFFIAAENTPSHHTRHFLPISIHPCWHVPVHWPSVQHQLLHIDVSVLGWLASIVLLYAVLHGRVLSVVQSIRTAHFVIQSMCVCFTHAYILLSSSFWVENFNFLFVSLHVRIFAS